MAAHYVDLVPPQNPLTRIRQVAEDLRALADELEESVGPDAKRALMYWRTELLSAVDELEHQTGPREREPGATSPTAAAPLARPGSP